MGDEVEEVMGDIGGKREVGSGRGENKRYDEVIVKIMRIRSRRVGRKVCECIEVDMLSGLSYTDSRSREEIEE